MLYVIYRMTIIYNPNICIIAKIIFKVEIKKKKIEEIQSNNSCSSVSFVSTPFLLVRTASSDWGSPYAPWMRHKNISVLTQEMSWKLQMQQGKEGNTKVKFWVFGNWLMSMGWTTPNGTLTDFNPYWLVCEELQIGATKLLKMVQIQIWTQEVFLTEYTV